MPTCRSSATGSSTWRTPNKLEADLRADDVIVRANDVVGARRGIGARHQAVVVGENVETLAQVDVAQADQELRVGIPQEAIVPLRVAHRGLEMQTHDVGLQPQVVRALEARGRREDAEQSVKTAW